MQLTIDQYLPPVSIHASAPTAVSPGDSFYLVLNVYSEFTVWLQSAEFLVPEGVEVDEQSFKEKLPYHLQANENLEIKIALTTQVGIETFGTINGHLYFSETNPEETPSQEPQSIYWENWVSVFKREKAPYPQRLSDELRRRLINVTNYHPRNPHIFLADFVAYFYDFLNIQIDEAAVAGIAEELPFSTEGLPLDPERRMLIAQGKMQFYGIKDFKFLAEEQCEEFDDIFQSDGTSDVDNGEVEV